MRALFLLGLLLWSSISMSETLKKISISRTNNAPDFLSSHDGIFEHNDKDYLKNLKAYVAAKGFNPNEKSELDFVVSALKWVSQQWSHDGINHPPDDFKALDILKAVHDKKEQYRCVEYGIVLSEMLQAYGFTARIVGLRAMDVAYGGWGRGHVAMEVWLNDIEKWIFLDPQFGAYLYTSDKTKPLNFFEIAQEHKSGKWKSLNVVFTEKHTEANYDSDYKDFLKGYFGHFKVSAGKGTPNVALLLEGEDLPLTFQANPLDAVVYTKDPSILYPAMNRVTVLLTYRDTKKDDLEIFKKQNIKTEEDYRKAMPLFAAVPKYTVSLKTADKVQRFEYRFDSHDKWKESKTGSFEWDALKEKNYLEVRAINELGRPGPVTFIEVTYK